VGSVVADSEVLSFIASVDEEAVSEDVSAAGLSLEVISRADVSVYSLSSFLVVFTIFLVTVALLGVTFVTGDFEIVLLKFAFLFLGTLKQDFFPQHLTIWLRREPVSSIIHTRQLKCTNNSLTFISVISNNFRSA